MIETPLAPTPWPARIARKVWSGPQIVGAQVPAYAGSWDENNRAALDSDGPLWIVLGDSLSQSIGASAWDRGWVHRSLSQISVPAAGEATPMRVVNLSRSGATTHDVLDRQLAELDRLRDQGHVPTLTSLLIGANDLLRRRLWHGLDERFATIAALLPHGTVVTELPQPLDIARRVNAVIDISSTGGRLRPVSVRNRAMLSPRNAAADLFHPSDRGHQILADLITPALQDALSGSPAPG